MKLNDFQYNWYLHFEEENEKSYFGLRFDPLLEAKNYSPETIPEYVRMSRKSLKRSKIPGDVDAELGWMCVTAYILIYFYINISLAFYEDAPSLFCPREDKSSCSSTSVASLMMYVWRGVVFFIPANAVVLATVVPIFNALSAITKKLHAILRLMWYNNSTNPGA